MPATRPHSGALKKRPILLGPLSVVRCPLSRMAGVSGVMTSARSGPTKAKRAVALAMDNGPKDKGDSAQPEVLRDNVALDIVRAGEDHAADAVAQLALQSGLLGVSGGPEEPDGVEAILDEALGDLELGHRGGHGGVLAPRVQVGVAIDHQSAGLQPEAHVDDPVRDGLELADRLAELLPRPRVLDAALELALHGAQGTGEDGAPLELHGGVEDR